MNPSSPPQTNPPQISRLRSLAPAALLLVAALVLDLTGIHWGLPSLRNYESFHPDEWTVIEAAQRVHLLQGKISPGFYHYGSLYVYCLTFAFQIAQALGAITSAPASVDPINKAHVYLVARCVTVAFSVGATILTWRLGRRLFGEPAGILAGFLLAITPLFAVYSHYAIVDVPATFWVVAAVLLAARAVDRRPRPEAALPANGKVSRKSPPVPLYLLAGAWCSGFAAGTKYNAVLCLLSCILALFWVFHAIAQEKGLLRTVSGKANAFGDVVYGWLVLAAVAFVAFLLSTPGFLVDRKAFLKDFSFEVWHVSTGHGDIFTHTAPGFILHVTHSLWIGMAPPLCVVALAGAAYALIRRTRGDALMAAAALPYYLVIGVAQVKFMRYTIPLLPFLCIWAARLLVDGLRARQSSAFNSSLTRVWYGAAVVCLAVAGGFALLKTAAYDAVLARKNVRFEAMDWIVSHVPEHASIGSIRTPWFDGPPLVPYNDIRLSEEWFEKHQDRWPWRLEFTGWSSEALAKDRPEYYVLTEWEALYNLRLHYLAPKGSSAAAKIGQESWSFIQTLNRDYQLAAVFSNPAAIGPITFGRTLPPPGQPDRSADGWNGWESDDWMIPNPTIWIYQQKGGA